MTDDKREDYQKCSVLYCVSLLCRMICAHTVLTSNGWFMFRCFRLLLFNQGYFVCITVTFLFCGRFVGRCEFGCQYQYNQLLGTTRLRI